MSPSLPNTGSSWGLLLGGEAYQYRVLPIGLAHSPRTFTKCVDAALAPLLQRTTYLGVVWDSTTMQAQLSPARIESILTSVARVREGRSLTVKQFQKLLGLMSAVSNVIPFGLLHMRPLQWWLKTKGVFPDGKSALHDQGHAVLLSCLRHVEETLVLITGPDAGSSLSSRNVNDEHVPHRLGHGHVWPPCPQSVERPPSHVAHLLPGGVGRISSIETLPPGPRRPLCVGCTDNTVVVSYINHQGGLCSCPLYRLAHQILVWALLSVTASIVRSPLATESFRGHDLQVWRRGHTRSQSVRHSSSSWRGTSQGYVCNSRSPRERDAASPAILPAFLRALPSFYQKLPLYPPHVLLRSLISKSPRHDVSPIHWTDYTHDSEHGHAEGVPKAFDAASRSLGELGLHT